MNPNENCLPFNVWEAIKCQAAISVVGQRVMRTFAIWDASLDSLLGPWDYDCDGFAYRTLNETGK